MEAKNKDDESCGVDTSAYIGKYTCHNASRNGRHNKGYKRFIEKNDLVLHDVTNSKKLLLHLKQSNFSIKNIAIKKRGNLL